MKISSGFILVVILASNIALTFGYNLHSYSPFLSLLSILAVEFLMLKLTDCLHICKVWLLIKICHHLVEHSQLYIKKDTYLESLLSLL